MKRPQKVVRLIALSLYFKDIYVFAIQRNNASFEIIMLLILHYAIQRFLLYTLSLSLSLLYDTNNNYLCNCYNSNVIYIYVCTLRTHQIIL